MFPTYIPSIKNGGHLNLKICPKTGHLPLMERITFRKLNEAMAVSNVRRRQQTDSYIYIISAINEYLFDLWLKISIQ